MIQKTFSKYWGLAILTLFFFLALGSCEEVKQDKSEDNHPEELKLDKGDSLKIISNCHKFFISVAKSGMRSPWVKVDYLSKEYYLNLKEYRLFYEKTEIFSKGFLAKIGQEYEECAQYLEKAKLIEGQDSLIDQEICNTKYMQLYLDSNIVPDYKTLRAFELRDSSVFIEMHFISTGLTPEYGHQSWDPSIYLVLESIKEGDEWKIDRVERVKRN